MSLDGAHTYDSTIDLDTTVSIGYNNDVLLLTAPLGFGTAVNAGSVDIGGSVHYGHHFTVSASRASNSHYEYSFNFEYDFSTSSDPFIAGSASDVIVGGGVDLVVNEGIEGLLLNFNNCTVS